VVLGVGTVVAFPRTALADDGDGAGGSTGTSSQQGSPNPTGVATADTDVTAPTAPTADSSGAAPSTATDHVGGTAPSSAVSAQTNTGSSTTTSTSATAEPSSPETTEPVVEETTPEPTSTTNPPSPAEPTGSVTLTAAPTDASDHAPMPNAEPKGLAAAADPAKSTTESAATPARAARLSSLASPSPTSRAVSGGEPMTFAATTAALAPTAPTVASDPLSALLAVPVSIITTLVNAFLTPIFGSPAGPAQPPLLWAVLSWVRREFQRTFTNSTPTAPSQNVTVSLALPNAVSGPVDFGATDADGDALTYTVPARGTVGGPSYGTVTIDQATGTFTYDPDDAYALTGGTDTFTYTVSDAGARTTFFGIPLSFSPTSATGTVAVTLNRVNVAPVINGDDTATSEDTPVTIAVLGNDTDANGNTLSVSGVGQATHGTTTFTASGVTYTPNANYSGIDSFTYTATDGSLTGTATVTVTVTAVDDSPGAVNDTTTVTEDSGTTLIPVLTNDTDIDAGPKTITGVTQPTGGTVTFTGTTLSYTPNANYNGIDSFTYTLNGGSTATVTVAATAVDDSPAAVNDTTTVAEDSGTTLIPVLANDTDVDGGPKTITGVTQGAHGTVAFTGATLSYTPNANFNGTDTFTYTLNGGSSATVAVTVTAVDDPPVVPNQNFTVVQGTTVAFDIFTGASDVEGDRIYVVYGSVQTVQHGVTYHPGSPESLYTYTPNPGFIGQDTYSYRVQNAGGASSGVTTTITFTVIAPPDASPVAVNDTATVVEDSGTTPIFVLANDTDVDAGPKIITAVTQPVNGNVTFTDTAVSYTPKANFNGVDTFTYTLNGGSAASTTVTVTAVNDAPVTKPMFLNDDEDFVGWYFNPFNGATDPDGDVLTLEKVVAPQFGSATLVYSGDQPLIFYKPLKDYAGPDNWSFVVSDGVLTTVTTVTVNLLPVNDPPVAANDTATVAAGGTTTIALLANDTDDAVNPATVVIVGQPRAGTVLVNADGTVAYTSTGTTSTTDSFTYTVKDTSGATSNAATVTVTVTGNAPPVAVNDAATVAEGGTTTIVLITNDTDADGTIDAATVVIVRQPAAGTATVNQNGTVTYVNNGSETRTDSFTYTVKDNTGALSNEATVTITITPVNDAPTAVNDSYTVAANGTLTISAPGLLANDTDPDGNTLAISGAFTPRNGTLSDVFSGGGFTYRPNAGFAGTDTFRYTISDGTATSEGIVSITVIADPNNVAPVGNPDSYTVNEDTVLTVNGPGLLANDTDANGQTLSVVTIGIEPTRGSLKLFSDGSFTYTPGPNLNGTDTFTYKATDGTAETAFTTVTINVTSVEDVPVAANDTIPHAKDTSVAYSLLNRVSDGDGDALTATLVSSTQHGTLQFLASQFAFVYTPNAGYTGTDSFTYKVNDGKADSAIATVTLTVT